MLLFLQIQNIRFPPGKSKGFGYCDFEDRQSLIEALNLNDEQIRNRKVRIDLADQHQSKKSRCHYDRVPTRTGKPGKMGRHFPVREKSGNF